MIKVKILEEVDKIAFNKFVDYSPFGDILQFWEWGEVKKTEGWKPLRVAVIEDKKILLTAQILLKKIPFFGNYAYIPHGPIFHNKNNLKKALGHFNKFLIRQSKNYNFVCIEIEPRIGKLVPIEDQVSPRSKNYVEQVLKKKSKFDDLDSIGEFESKLDKNIKKFSLNANKETAEILEIDPTKIEIEKITALSLNGKKRRKKPYNINFYGPQKFEDSKGKTEKELELDIKQKIIPNQPDKNLKAEIIPNQENNQTQLAIQQQKKPIHPHSPLPIKSVSLDEPLNPLEYLKAQKANHNLTDQKNNHFSQLKSLKQDSRIKNKAEERLKKEFNQQEIMGEKPSKPSKDKKQTKQTIPVLEEKSPIKPLVDPEVLKIFQEHGYDLTGRNMQPKHKLYYDLNLSPEGLLKLCKKNTRYNIKYAQKKGVKVQEFLPNHKIINLKIQKFYKLLLETQKRSKGYPVRPMESFFNLFKAFRKTDNLSLFEASYNQEAIIINISQRTKYWSSSFYAGSNRKYPKLKAPYLLRWASIMAAKNYGSKLYDFWGIIPDSKEHKGYSQQKLSFGGIRVENYGLLAFPISPIKYSLWDTGIWLRTEGVKKLREVFWQLKNKVKQD